MHLAGNLTQKKNLGIIMSHFTKLNLRDMELPGRQKKISDRAMGTHLFLEPAGLWYSNCRVCSMGICTNGLSQMTPR